MQCWGIHSQLKLEPPAFAGPHEDAGKWHTTICGIASYAVQPIQAVHRWTIRWYTQRGLGHTCCKSWSLFFWRGNNSHQILQVCWKISLQGTGLDMFSDTELLLWHMKLVSFLLYFYFGFFPPTHYRGWQLLLHLITFNKTHTHTHTHTHLVGLLWMKNWPVTETCTWQKTTFTDICAPGRFWTHNPSKQAAANPLLDRVATRIDLKLISTI